jgi:hypothetical protein
MDGGLGLDSSVRRNNPFAVGAIIASLCGFVPFVGLAGAIGGIVMGLMARRQIRNSFGTQTGEGLATAGIVIGVVSLLVAIFFILVIVATIAGHGCTTVNGSTTCSR